jgi:hypothetical protein
MDDDDATSALHMLRRIDAKVEGLSVESVNSRCA